MKANLAWRLYALLAIVIYVVLMLGFILLLAHNIGLAILTGFTSVLLLYAVWLALSGSRKSRKIGGALIILATIGLVVELIYFLSDKENRRASIAIIGLTALYLIFIAMLRKKYWSLMRLQGEHSGSTARFKNPYLIINPKSGNGRAVKARIDVLAKQQGIHVIMTQKGVDIESLAHEAVEAGADVLGISGGDGSIGAVAKVAIEKGLPIVVLPGGTRCHFARDLGLDPKRITDSLAGFTGVERRVDVAEINGRIFLNNASFGLYADIVDDPEYREHKMRVSKQVLSSMLQGSKDLYDLRFRHNTLSVKKAVQVLVGVNRYNTLNLLELGHRKRLDEGVVQVTAITRLDDQIVRRLLGAIAFSQLGRNKNMPGFYQWVDDTFAVTSASGRIVVGVDGEREMYKTPVKIHIKPKALRVYVPAEGERSRRINPFSMSMIRRVWQAGAHDKF